MKTNDDGTVTYTKEDLDNMTPEAVNNIMMLKPKIKGTGVVRRADGTIRYDDPSKEGTYGENLT